MIRKAKSKANHSILRILLLSMMLIGTMFCGHASSQEYPSTIESSEEIKTVTKKRFEDGRLHIAASADAASEQKPPAFLLVPLFSYLVKTKGRVPIVSSAHGKFQVELGLSGYVGIKWLF